MGKPVAVHLPARPWWSTFVIVALLLLAAPAALVAAPAESPAPSFVLWTHSYPSMEYTPLDPSTLADPANVKPLEFSGPFAALLTSADGSTIVTVAHHNDGTPDTVVVRDGLAGPVRVRFDLTDYSAFAQLSQDGRRLAVWIASALTGNPPHWQVFDTRTSKAIASIPSPEHRAGMAFLDQTGTRLYQPFYATAAPQPAPDAWNRVPIGGPKPATAPSPWPLRISAWDLTTGTETGEAAVPGMTGGTWPGSAIDGDPVMHMVQPAVALSPDGTRLAVIDAAGTQVTLLDARILRVTGTHALHRPESAAHRVLRWLGLAPQTAEAKFMTGDQLAAVFAPDGQHLYLSGIETSLDAARKTTTGTGLGVRRIDVNTGAVTAEALTGSQLETVLPAPDGRSLYVSGPTTPWWTNQSGPATYEVRRLDAATLRPLAERTVAGQGMVDLVLAPSNEHG